jgi:twitching motility protein PilT
MRHNLPEKRKAYRLYAQMHVKCDILNPDDRSIRTKNAVATNINSEGIYLEMDEILALNTEINVSFQLHKSENRIQASVRVVRVEIIEEQKIYGMGSIFDKIDTKDKEEITQLIERLNIGKLLDLAIKKGASDMHLLADQAPVLRVHGELDAVDGPKLFADEVPQLLYSIMNKQQIKKFEADKELDFGIQYDMRNRFRVNVHQQKGFVEATFRLINTKISSFEELAIPEVVKDMARQREGLILITGPTGSGKTTTIAAMLELINHEKKAVIITLERPIEYVHTNVKSIIKQREVGIDTNSFSAAIKSSLKQDPNIIVIGELEDFETVRTALIAAEAGYLVICSFHAPNTVQAIDRLVSFFPLDSRRQALTQLSTCLKGVVSHLLLPRKDHTGRVLATEIVVASDAVKRIVRKDELVQLPTIVQTSGAYRMQSMSDSIRKYLEMDVIDAESALFYSEEFNRYSQHI